MNIAVRILYDFYDIECYKYLFFGVMKLPTHFWHYIGNVWTQGCVLVYVNFFINHNIMILNFLIMSFHKFILWK